MRLKKYVMLVDRETGPLARLVPRLRELDFRVVLVPDPLAALEFVRAFPKLSMIAVSDTRDPDQNAHLLSKIREMQPSLPLLWHGAPHTLPAGVQAEILPHDGLTAGDLVACAERMLCQHFYPQDFAVCLAETALMSFGAFGAHATCADPFLKASRTRLAELSAVIAFSGTMTSGHLLVSAGRSAAADAHSRMFPDAPPANEEAMMDLLGECSNRIIGRLVAYFEKRGRPFTFGVPIYLAGDHCVLWQGAHGPSLALEFEGLSGRLFTEFCIDAFDPIQANNVFPDDLLQTGQCILL